VSADIEDWLAEASLPEDEVALCLRRDLTGRFRELERRLRTANTTAVSLAEPSEAKVIARQIEELRAEMAKHERVFHLRALRSLEWAAFYASMPQRTKDESVEDFTTKRFYPKMAELVTRCCYDPVMTVDQLNRLVDRLAGSQWNELSGAVWDLNADREGVPFSAAAYAMTASSGDE
jgi:hypothetical protein